MRSDARLRHCKHCSAKLSDPWLTYSMLNQAKLYYVSVKVAPMGAPIALTIRAIRAISRATHGIRAICLYLFVSPTCVYFKAFGELLLTFNEKGFLVVFSFVDLHSAHDCGAVDLGVPNGVDRIVSLSGRCRCHGWSMIHG